MENEFISYVTDIHGDLQFIEGVLKESSKRKVIAVVINGDITPDEYFMDMLAQRDFFESCLFPLFEKFRKKSRADVFILMGNHDYEENMDVFENAEKRGIIKVLHNKVHKIKEFLITGYSYINPAGTFNWEKPESEIKKDLENLAKKIPKNKMNKTIFVSHAPPFNTKLDVRYGNYHVGSKSIFNFIKKYQPYLSLHGHIHESPDLTKHIADKIGNTLAVNPGNRKLVFIDLKNLEIEKC